MRLYECIFIVRQDMTSSQVEGLASHYTTVIRSFEGDVTKTEVCGLRTLAYPIKKNKKGYYVLLNIKADPKAIQEIERQMYINEDILRYMTVFVETLNPNPSALMQQRAFKDEKFFSDDSDMNDKEEVFSNVQ
jgi:small subunit ribosomal protein S6